MTIPEISREEQLTPTHVAKLTMLLRKGGFLKSTRGQSGGYALDRSSGAYSRLGMCSSALGGKAF